MRGSVNVPGKIGALFAKHLKASNPHSVTKEQVGLGNVPNVGTNDQTPSYTAASSLAALSSGEKLSVAFGKLAKAVSSLISHLSASNPHGISASGIGAVPTTRKVNGKDLSADISLTASDVGADSSGAASTAVSTHNSNTAAHNDIRQLITELTTRLNALADSDDTTLDQLSEVVAYIKSNKSLIDAITTAKISYTDIVNDLITNNSGKPLSAAQGVALKALIDAVSANLASHTGNKSNPHGVTAAQTGAATTKTFSQAIDTSWTANSAGGYYKTVTVSGVLASDEPITDVVLGDDVDANALYKTAWALVDRVKTAANTITLYANGEAPASAFTVKLKVVK